MQLEVDNTGDGWACTCSYSRAPIIGTAARIQVATALLYNKRSITQSLLPPYAKLSLEFVSVTATHSGSGEITVPCYLCF